MDFLTLFIGYLCIMTVIAVAYCFSGSRVIRGSFDLLEHKIWPIAQKLFPQTFKNIIFEIRDWLLYRRNPLYQSLYCSFTAVGHFVLYIDVLPYLYAFDPNTNHTTLPTVLLTLTAILFALCSWSDPGLITRENVKQYRSIYLYDNIVYQTDEYCDDCKIVRPARTRHCIVCNKCVLRYDHHCVWTNSCIGFYNHRYFFTLLFAISSSGGYAVVLGIRVLWIISEKQNLWNAQYVDDQGKLRDMTIWMLVQHLFFEFPRIVMFVAGVTTIVFFLQVFFIYHFYLNITNQTSYERNKRTFLDETDSNIYDKGVWNNLKEVFLTHVHRTKKSKKLRR